jgi:7-carboxy-7-deazaguanine synthase
MLGKNEVTHAFRRESGELMVNDIFHTIQGEGPDAGVPAVFVRLAKCNLRCFFCDTEFEKGTWMPPQAILNAIYEAKGKRDCELVVITGGEPLLQNITPLTAMINEFHMRVSVETAGTTFYSELYHHFKTEQDRGRWQPNRIVVSPKTPKLHGGINSVAYAWKYIVSVAGTYDPQDGLPIQSTQIHGELARLARPFQPPYHRPRVYIQPMDEGDKVKNDANARLAAEIAILHGYNLSLQMHKLVGLP